VYAQRAVGRKTRRARDYAYNLKGIAPDLSRAVRMPDKNGWVGTPIMNGLGSLRPDRGGTSTARLKTGAD
jgi:hypothetical protein